MTDSEAIVAPGPPLSPERLARYSRQLALPGFDDIAQRRLDAARVLFVGAGGLGSAGVPYLAAAGVGTIGVIDTDTVELSNLHRQVSHGMADLGRSKVASIIRTVAALDPHTVVRPHEVRLTSQNALEIFADYDLVLDGSDNFATRYLVSDAATLTQIPLVWGAILQYSGQVGVSWAGRGPGYRDLFPVPPAPGDVPSCSVGGVLPSVCAVIGSMMSSEALKLITGIGEPLLGRVTSYDALSGRFREIAYRAIPEAKPVTELIDYELFCGTSTAPDAGEAAAEPSASITPTELSEKLRAGAALQLIDVREPFEAQIATIDGAELIPLGGVEAARTRVRQDVPVVLYCHYDTRSQHAARLLRRHGITNVRWLQGGIDAYAETVDPSLNRY